MFWRRRDNDPVHDDPGAGSEDLLLEQLSAYLDGEVTEAEAAEVEALIARDDAAAELLSDLGLMRSAFGALGEVRAPRSFAIPADVAVAGAPGAAATRASGLGGGSLAIFRRSELFMRASAAVAALFFVVALVNNPSGSTPIATLQEEAVESFQAQAEDAAASGPALEPGQGEAAGAMLAPAPAGTQTPSTDTTGGGGSEVGTASLAMPKPEDGGASGASSAAGAESAEDAGVASTLTAEASSKGPETVETAPGDSSRSAGELRPLPTGTELVEDASESVGGMAPALGILAGLLTAMSALTAWSRRSGNSTR